MPTATEGSDETSQRQGTAGTSLSRLGGHPAPLFVVPDDLSTLHADGRLRRTVGSGARRYLGPYLVWLSVSDLIVITGRRVSSSVP